MSLSRSAKTKRDAWRTQVHMCLYFDFSREDERTSSTFEITRPFRKAHSLCIRRPLCWRIRGSARATRLRIIAVKREAAARDSEIARQFCPSACTRNAYVFFFLETHPFYRWTAKNRLPRTGQRKSYPVNE